MLFVLSFRILSLGHSYISTTSPRSRRQSVYLLWRTLARSTGHSNVESTTQPPLWVYNLAWRIRDLGTKITRNNVRGANNESWQRVCRYRWFGIAEFSTPFREDASYVTYKLDMAEWGKLLTISHDISRQRRRKKKFRSGKREKEEGNKERSCAPS